MIQLLHYFERTTGEIAADSHSEKIEKLQKRVEQVKMSEEVGIRFMNAFEEKMMERRDSRSGRGNKTKESADDKRRI